jgi:hypothetical protein
MPNTMPTDEKIISILCRYQLNELDAEGAAAALSIDPAEFVGLLKFRPELMEEATRLAKEDSGLAVASATAGLNKAAAILAGKLDNAHELSVSEITAITGQLDKLAAVSKSQELAAKASPEAPEKRTCGPTMLRDVRPWPGGQHGFRLVVLPQDHPAMLESVYPNLGETEEDHRARMTAWWNRWFPTGEDNGLSDIGKMLQDGLVTRYHDGHRWHEG